MKAKRKESMTVTQWRSMELCDRVVYASTIDQRWLSRLDIDAAGLSDSDRGMLAYYFPGLRDHWDINSLDDYWRTAICWKYPEKFKHLSISKKRDLQWSELLSRRPQFGRYCDFAKLSGADWADLLAVQPHFAKRFVAKKSYSAIDWFEILSVCPPLKKCCPLSQFRTVRERFAIALASPDLFPNITPASLTKDDWCWYVHDCPSLKIKSWLVEQLVALADVIDWPHRVQSKCDSCVHVHNHEMLQSNRQKCL